MDTGASQATVCGVTQSQTGRAINTFPLAFCFSLCAGETQAETMLLSVQSTRELVKKAP